VLGHVKFDNLDGDVIDAFWDRLEKDGVPYPMRWEVLVQLRTLINYVLQKRPHTTVLRYNPAKFKLVNCPRPVPKKKPAPNAANLAALLNAAKGDEYELVVHVAMQVGLRLANIVGLRFSDFGADGILGVQRRTNRVN